ncbi:MAG: hypothetical protein N2544_13175 [Burkholderiales bacterium]|nr:hypothetical protein [Burkholderiales bacterium]
MTGTAAWGAATPRAVFIGANQYRQPAYGRNHPLAIPRVSLAFDLLEAFGALAAEERAAARPAADVELEWFHTREYVAAMRRSEALGRVSREDRERHRIGIAENPYFERFFSIPATAAGASIQAAEAVLAGRVAFNPAGGMHHARPDHAQGFCYFNDVALAILRLRRAGLRVAYVDLDAHHGDGVEEAFARDADVLTVSLHMDTVYAYPGRGGSLGDAGSPAAGHTTLNMPLARDVNDAEYLFVAESVVPRALAKFRPDAVVLQAGTDMIAGDPLGKWNLATQTFLAACALVIRAAPAGGDGRPRLMATGGGGYHPILVARAWAGLWALLSGRELPDAIPPEGEALLRGVRWEGEDEEDPRGARLFASRLDAPRDAPVRPEARCLVERALAHPFFRQ